MESSGDAVSVEGRLTALLEQSAAFGFLGPGPITEHIDHARRLIDPIREQLRHDLPATLLDLGSGGGIPGLVLAVDMADVAVTLLDSQQRRCAFLRSAADQLALGHPVHVAHGRAETLARQPEYEGTFGVVVARSFGPPSAVAECAVRFLAVGAALVVTEPPTPDPQRWPDKGVQQLGYAPAIRYEEPLPHVVLTKTETTPTGFPRREGVPTRKLLWG